LQEALQPGQQVLNDLFAFGLVEDLSLKLSWGARYLDKPLREVTG